MKLAKLTKIFLVLALLLAGGLWLARTQKVSLGNLLPAANSEKIGRQAVDFINAHLLSKGQKAEFVGVTEEDGVYKIQITISGRSTPAYAYATKDGRLLFPNAFNLQNPGSGNIKNGQNSQPTATPKVPADNQPSGGYNQ